MQILDIINQFSKYGYMFQRNSDLYSKQLAKQVLSVGQMREYLSTETCFMKHTDGYLLHELKNNDKITFTDDCILHSTT
jgi:hypothetical protein